MWCLCCSNADTEVKNLDGKTAVEVAELNEQTGVVVLMKAHATSATVVEELQPEPAVA